MIQVPSFALKFHYSFGEVLDKNPLDFYSVGVLFPQVGKKADPSEIIPENLENKSIDESLKFDRVSIP